MKKGSNSFTSNVLEHIFRNRDYANLFDSVYEDDLEDLDLPRTVSITNYYVTLDSDGHKYYNEADEYYCDELGKEVPYDGQQYTADMNVILSELDYSRGFLDSLEKTYIYDLYNAFKNLYLLLEDKYRSKSQTNIIDILD